MRSFVAFIFFCFFSFYSYSQDTAFAYTYGSYGDDVGRSLAQSPDSGFIIVGASGSFGNGNSDVYIIRIDSLGKHLWSKVYGENNAEWANSIKCFNDGTCIIVGYTNSFGNGGYDVYVIKINSQGDTLWTKTFGGNKWDFGYAVHRTFEGGYIICGETYSDTYGENDILLIKISENGEWEWQKTYGGTLQDFAKDVVQLPDSGFLIAGTTESVGSGMLDYFLIRTNKWGDTLYTKTYGGVKNDIAFSMHYNQNDQTIAIAGMTENYGALNRDFYIVRTNLLGDTIWTNRINGPDGDEEWFSITMDNAGDYILTGYSYSIIGAGYEDVFFMKITPNKQILQLTTYGWLEYERGYCIIPCMQGGHAIAATTNSFGNGNNDVFFIKTKSDGLYSYQNSPAEVFHDTTHIHISIYSIQNNLSVKIYPQPATDYLHIDLNFLEQTDFTANAVLYNQTGTAVYKNENISDFSFQIPIDNISAGNYFLQVFYTTGNNNSEIKRFSSKISVVK